MDTQIVVITGGNKGIGYETAKKILRETSCIVVLTSRNEQAGNLAVQTLIEELKLDSQRLLFHQLDITQDSHIDNIKKFISSNFGQIDVLVNNAGIRHSSCYFDYEIAHSTLMTNFYGTVKMCDAMIPLIKSSGHIINISSSMGKAVGYGAQLKSKICSPDIRREELFELAQEFLDSIKTDTVTEKGWKKKSYSVSKLLLNSFTEILHRELREKGSSIRVNALHPGWIRTDMGSCFAPKSLKQGAVSPAFLINYQGEISGQYWDDDCQIDNWRERRVKCPCSIL